MHGFLQGVPQWPEVQEAVARLCLAWWAADAPGREALVAQALPYLLLRALATGAPCSRRRPVAQCKLQRCPTLRRDAPGVPMIEQGAHGLGGLGSKTCAPGREALGAQALPYLLLRALATGALPPSAAR